ncbi:TVP38/TMEM64 family protein [Atopobacter phocae]|uniref:TVP38/TMEM64 family protein n=1 Tax=Atopobacter phocae TaxID=136492 RepID=UPI0004712FB3|nr:VTT domain-containing protein [Atopobacter phocae]
MFKRQYYTRLFNILNIIGTMGLILFILYLFKQGVLTDEARLIQFMKEFGRGAPVVFMLIQLIQTVIPIIPGGLTIPLGTMLFGNYVGYLLNLVPILIGSYINFYLARRYGRPFVYTLLGFKQYKRAIRWLNKGEYFKRFFTIAMFFPLSPDDVLCYVAGLSDLNRKQFSTILLLSKPFNLFLYAYGTETILKWLIHFFA